MAVSTGCTDVACTRTSTSVNVGSGTGRSTARSTSGPPKESWLIANIVVGMAVLLARASALVSGGTARLVRAVSHARPWRYPL